MNWADELVESLTVKEVPEDAITTGQLAEKTGLSQRQCSSILNKKVKTGELQKITVKNTGYFFQ